MPYLSDRIFALDDHLPFLGLRCRVGLPLAFLVLALASASPLALPNGTGTDMGAGVGNFGTGAAPL